MTIRIKPGGGYEIEPSPGDFLEAESLDLAERINQLGPEINPDYTHIENELKPAEDELMIAEDEASDRLKFLREVYRLLFGEDAATIETIGDLENAILSELKGRGGQ